MTMRRRQFLAVGGATFAAVRGVPASFTQRQAAMYGLLGKMIAAPPGKRDELIAILLEGLTNMPGCLSYIVATDPSDAQCDLDAYGR